MKQLLTEHRWTIMAGLVFALLLQPAAPMLRQWYETSAPVVDMQGVVVERTASYAVIHITGKKLRMCEFVRVSALLGNARGDQVASNVEKLGDVPSTNNTIPVGTHDTGLWRVWPLRPDSVRVSVLVQHSCSGELVLSRIADVDLGAAK